MCVYIKLVYNSTIQPCPTIDSPNLLWCPPEKFLRSTSFSSQVYNWVVIILQTNSGEATSPKPPEHTQASNPAHTIVPETDKNEKNTTPTDTSELTTTPSEESIKKDVPESKETRVLAQGDSLNDTQDFLESNDGDETSDKISESPSRSRKRMNRMGSMKTSLPSIIDNNTATEEENDADRWKNMVLQTEWSEEIPYQPPKFGDSSAVSCFVFSFFHSAITGLSYTLLCKRYFTKDLCSCSILSQNPPLSP